MNKRDLEYFRVLNEAKVKGPKYYRGFVLWRKVEMSKTRRKVNPNSLTVAKYEEYLEGRDDNRE